MDDELLDILRIVNREFQEFIGKVAQDGANAVQSPGAARRLEQVNLRLNQVSQRLAAGPRYSLQVPAAQAEVVEYAETLRTLQSTIGALQATLLVEKSHLDSVRANLNSACAWASTLREIS